MSMFALSNVLALSTFALPSRSWLLLPLPSAAVLSRFQEPTSAAEEGLTLGDIVESLPTDLGSLVALALLAGFVGFVIYYGQRPGGSKPGDSKPSGSRPSTPQDPTDGGRPWVR